MVGKYEVMHPQAAVTRPKAGKAAQAGLKSYATVS